jgi:small conductance mechanosensitive channel
MFFEELISIIGQKLLKILLFLIGGEVAKKIISVFIRRLRLAPKKLPEKLGKAALIQRQERIKTLASLIKNTIQIVVNFIVLVMILSELGVNILPLLTGAGILGLAVGFGAKSLVADLIAGFFIILENQFNVGDEIEIGKIGQGKVTKISLRTIVLKNKEGRIYIIPNSSIKYVAKLPKKT